MELGVQVDQSRRMCGGLLRAWDPPTFPALSAPRATASARDGSSLHQRDLSRFAPISIEVQEKLGGYSGPSSNTQEVLLDEVTEALIIARILETIHVPQLPDHNPR